MVERFTRQCRTCRLRSAHPHALFCMLRINPKGSNYPAPTHCQCQLSACQRDMMILLFVCKWIASCWPFIILCYNSKGAQVRDSTVNRVVMTVVIKNSALLFFWLGCKVDLLPRCDAPPTKYPTRGCGEHGATKSSGTVAVV